MGGGSQRPLMSPINPPIWTINVCEDRPVEQRPTWLSFKQGWEAQDPGRCSSRQQEGPRPSLPNPSDAHWDDPTTGHASVSAQSTSRQRSSGAVCLTGGVNRRAVHSFRSYEERVSTFIFERRGERGRCCTLHRERKGLTNKTVLLAASVIVSASNDCFHSWNNTFW